MFIALIRAFKPFRSEHFRCFYNS